MKTTKVLIVHWKKEYQAVYPCVERLPVWYEFETWADALKFARKYHDQMERMQHYEHDAELPF